MENFYYHYNPITAMPFRNDSSYMEVTPCDDLKPFIKCFWGTKDIKTNYKNDSITKELVVPDSCMDIIFDINYTENKIRSSFVGINNETVLICSKSEKEEMVSTFGIRFYPWSAVLFSEDSMNGVKNQLFDAGQHYGRIKSELEPLLFDIASIYERSKIAESFLRKVLNRNRINPSVEKAVFYILKNKGNLRTTFLSDEVFLSNRQLERLFKDYIAISPKQFSSLVRYQYLWNDILYRKQFNAGDAVLRYGYTDQSHLVNDFKKYHTLSPGEAKEYALQKSDNVVNLQYKKV